MTRLDLFYIAVLLLRSLVAARCVSTKTRRENQPVLQNAIAGLMTPLEGLGYLWRRPRLWRYAITPIVCNLIITALVLAALIWSGIEASNRLSAYYPSGILGSAAWLATLLVLLVVAFALAVGAWLLLGGILCGYFYGRLAYQVELELGTPAAELRELSLYYQTVDVLRDFAFLVVVSVGCLLIALVPVVGAALGGAIALYYDSMIFGVEYLDYPLALRGWRRRDKWRFAERHRPYTLGLGAAVMLLNFLPIVGSVLLAGAAVGGVLTYHRLEDSHSL